MCTECAENNLSIGHAAILVHDPDAQQQLEGLTHLEDNPSHTISSERETYLLTPS